MDTATTATVRPRRAVLTPLRAGQIDAILPFLEPLSAPGFSPGEWTIEPGQGPWFSEAPAVTSLRDALYANGWVDGHFNWPDWQEAAQEFVAPGRVTGADVKTIRQLFTTHLRKDRFSEGHLAAMLECGHIRELLERLHEIRATARVIARP